jgi:hypothetical protein
MLQLDQVAVAVMFHLDKQAAMIQLDQVTVSDMFHLD